MNIEQERKDFETAYTQHCKPLATPDLRRCSDGVYGSTNTQDLWDMWQARAAISQPMTLAEYVITPKEREAVPEEAWAMAKAVWRDLDRLAFPGIYLQATSEAIIKRYPQPVPLSNERIVQIGTEKLGYGIRQLGTMVTINFARAILATQEIK